MSNNTNEPTVDNVVVETVAAFVQANGDWVGTMTQLSKKIARVAGRTNRSYLPGSPSALRKVIDRNIRRIRSRGISARFNRTSDRARTRIVVLKRK
jgi:hypothetical protein